MTQKKQPKPIFETLLKKADAELAAYEKEVTKPTERLYALLEAAYRMEMLGKEQKYAKEYRNFINREFTKRNLGDVTEATENAPFMRAIRLIFGNDKERSPDRTRYSLALATVEAQNGKHGANIKVADIIKSYPKKIDGLVKEARAAKRKIISDEREKIGADKKGKAIILMSKPIGKIPNYAPAEDKEEFRLVLARLDANGELEIYDEETKSGVDALFLKAHDREENRLQYALQAITEGSAFFSAKEKCKMILMNQNGRCYAYIATSFDSQSCAFVKTTINDTLVGLPNSQPILIDHKSVLPLTKAAALMGNWGPQGIKIEKDHFSFERNKSMVRIFFSVSTEVSAKSLSSFLPFTPLYSITHEMLKRFVELGKGAKDKTFDLTLLPQKITVKVTGTDDQRFLAIKSVKKALPGTIKITVPAATLIRAVKYCLKAKTPTTLAVENHRLWLMSNGKGAETRIYVPLV